MGRRLEERLDKLAVRTHLNMTVDQAQRLVAPLSRTTVWAIRLPFVAIVGVIVVELISGRWPVVVTRQRGGQDGALCAAGSARDLQQAGRVTHQR